MAGRMSKKRIVFIAVAGAAGLALLFAIWSAFLSPVTVKVAQAERDVPVQVFGLGTVEARVTSKIGFKVSGVLVDLAADVGDRVPKGAVLARLDDREQSARVARAKAATEQTEATLQRAMASLDKAQANYANAKVVSERRQKLVQSATTSVESAETAKTAEDTTRADVNLASSDVAVARAAIGDAKAQLQLETATLDFHTLTVPYDAMVTSRTKELGSALGGSEPVFTVIDPKSVWVLAFIDESKAGEIKVGAVADIVLRSQPGRHIAGRVARIQPESDRVNEERRIEVAFDQLSKDFNLGEQAEVYITAVHLAQAQFVPEAAIAGLVKDSGTVWTVEDGVLRQHTVTLGHRLLDGRREITGGMPSGAAVVTELTSHLREGRAAKVEAAIAKAAAGKAP